MITFKKLKVCFLLIFVFVNIFYIEPCYSLSSREDFFKNALDLSSGGQFNLALQEWNRYLDLYPDDAAGLSNRGNVKLVIGDLEGSIDDQNKSISLSPSEIDPYINRGIAEEALGLWAQAKKDYMFVISKDSKNFSALYNLANVEGSTSQWEKARDLFSKAALYNPGFAMARSSMALADYQLGNIDESEKELKKLIRRYPTFADARAALTALNWYKNEFGQAESNWISVTELDPRYSEEEWLIKVRRWPPKPTKDLMNFIDLK
ncbi:tetratricopeptide repeat protein [uncultured Prochlorococcus sp.]|uniref:tetratricopeptide repeat protein n=1 Tax=uncultured Prochlorococcus sp. TaxID=159733 RepID=UPI002585325B|nr:tetratricopeptide repeat protein [uncultured Prochlorococcus sp.]